MPSATTEPPVSHQCGTARRSTRRPTARRCGLPPTSSAASRCCCCHSPPSRHPPSSSAASFLTSLFTAMLASIYPSLVYRQEEPCALLTDLRRASRARQGGIAHLRGTSAGHSGRRIAPLARSFLPRAPVGWDGAAAPVQRLLPRGCAGLPRGPSAAKHGPTTRAQATGQAKASSGRICSRRPSASPRPE